MFLPWQYQGDIILLFHFVHYLLKTSQFKPGYLLIRKRDVFTKAGASIHLTPSPETQSLDMDGGEDS